MELHLTGVVSKLLPALAGAAALAKNLENGNRIVHQGIAFGDLNDDTEIAADQILGSYFQEYFREWHGIITVEGKKDLDSTVMGSVGMPRWICIDPLDGSLNFMDKGNSLGLPYTSCVTVLDRNSPRDQFKFSDVKMAGIIDLRSQDVWLSERGVDGTTFNLRPAITHRAQSLDLTKMIVIGEFYYPENREKLAKAFTGKKGWLRNPGSAAYEMALVSSGHIAAYICDRQKQHELGAAYLLTKGAGGVAVDFDGKDLGERVFDFKTQTPVILAANQAIADQVLELVSTVQVPA